MVKGRERLNGSSHHAYMYVLMETNEWNDDGTQTLGVLLDHIHNIAHIQSLKDSNTFWHFSTTRIVVPSARPSRENHNNVNCFTLMNRISLKQNTHRHTTYIHTYTHIYASKLVTSLDNETANLIFSLISHIYIYIFSP